MVVKGKWVNDIIQNEKKQLKFIIINFEMKFSWRNTEITFLLFYIIIPQNFNAIH